MEARDFARRLEAGIAVPRIFDGSSFHEVTEAGETKQTTQLIDVCFDAEDAAVLAWHFPGKRPRSISCSAAVACLGRQVADRTAMLGVEEKCTFVDVGSSSNRSQRRARSAGAASDPRSGWSAGTRFHDRSDPARCQVCSAHHRFMQDPFAQDARPCKKGPGCRYCHAPHAERGTRVRP
mmetsp:Transcript_22566/g.56874  ORF Transcript_22566/g.56874 Transcript_22566/m.56874 type:complete len:179 (-) Transcript_22566:62-598(-)